MKHDATDRRNDYILSLEVQKTGRIVATTEHIVRAGSALRAPAAGRAGSGDCAAQPQVPRQIAGETLPTSAMTDTNYESINRPLCLV